MHFVRAGNGVEILAPQGPLCLDPAREAGVAVVSHGHEDHLPARPRKGEPPGEGDLVMTAPTLDLLKLRRPGGRGRAVKYGEEVVLNGASVLLRDAGHVCGSAMVRLEFDGHTILYTGDFSPAGGATSGRAQPERVDELVIEATYGDPRFSPPPRALVLANLESWVLRGLLGGSVALGAHELGRAQELIRFLNAAGVAPVVSGEIGRICAIYNAHGHDLAWHVLGSPKAEELAGNACYVVPQTYLKKTAPFVQRLKAEKGHAAYLSGWCQVYSYFENYAIDAQFPITDHATFPELLSFVEACAPKRVWTFHGKSERLAQEIEKRLGIPARALE